MKPQNITITEILHNKHASNMTISWNRPVVGRVDAYHINITHDSFTMSYIISAVTTVMVTDILYDEHINIRVTAVNCHSESEGTDLAISLCK